MVTLNHLSVEDPDEGCPLTAEAEEGSPSSERLRPRTTSSERPQTVFISRTTNLLVSAVLLVSCYSVILIPAYVPSHKTEEVREHPQDPVLLNQSASVLSRPCQPQWCLTRLKPLSCSAGLFDIPVFLQPERGASWERPPPLGLQGSEERLALALASLPQPGLPSALGRKGPCRRCVVVGNGGVLLGSHLGSHIDQYDVIIRLNNAPVPGFERDAGSQTTIRLMYPEGAPHSAEEYKQTSMVALVVFKSLDLDWLVSVITKQPLSLWSKMWFWREVVEDIPLRPENFRILHPEIIHKTGLALQTYALRPGNMVPTLGASAVVMALQLCDHVSLAGFGYDMKHPEAPLHYYEQIRMDAMAAQVVHDVSAEKLFLRDLVAAGAVTDLTGAL